MTFQERIKSSYSLNSQLVATLSFTCKASREVKETSRYITELQSRIQMGMKDLKSLQRKVQRLRSDFEGLRDGSTKRLFSKVSGKTDELVAKISNAEQEYENALEEQAKANKNLETCHMNLEEAQRSLAHLKDQAAIHTATTAELDELYSSIFSLPHADYPQETTANQEIALLHVPISSLQTQIDTESQALKLLTNARKSLIWSIASIQNAQDADHNKGSPFHEHHLLGLNIVRNSMSTAQLHAMQADSTFGSAQMVQPSIQNMRELKILDEDYLLGRTYRSGMSIPLDTKELTHRIEKCIVEMKPVVDDVAKETDFALNRVQRLGVEKKELEDEAKDALRKARQDVIEMVVEGRREDGEGRAVVIDEQTPVPLGPPGYTP